MYKIMVADDEKIVLQSLKMIIQKNFGQSCEIELTKTGRGVIELAESFRPDIALIDIQMPGINGIDAIEEVQKFSQSTYFIIISAFDKFDYAKKAIDLGVVEFLTKPFNVEKITKVLEKVMRMVDNDRHNREVHLKNREKLETVVPIIESDMIYTILFQEDYGEQINHFKQLLDIEEAYGFIMIIEFGDEMQEQRMTNLIGASVKVQKYYREFREIVKNFFKCHMGALMANKVVVFVPCEKPEIEYNERIKIIEQARDMVHKLKKHIDIEFKVGIGSAQKMEQLLISYKEAAKAIRMTQGSISHIKDIIPQQMVCHNDLADLEKNLLYQMKKRNLSDFLSQVNALYEALKEIYSLEDRSFQMKLLESLIIVQQEVKDYTAIEYKKDTKEISSILEYRGEALKVTFTNYMSWLYQCREGAKEEVYSDIIMEAKELIDHSYSKDINLEMISRKVNISPYYFSKIFKEETGENFIDYVTAIRIEKAKEVLKERDCSIKEVCIQVGYKDPNYFSRLFKKQVGVTPTEYREGL